MFLNLQKLCVVHVVVVVDLHFVCVGLVVPDLPLEETTLLRSEATMHNIELVGPHSHLAM
jgi:tryptophan synthase alpha subunit